MKVRYEDGPEVVLIAELGVQVERGETVEVPTEVGEKLVEQGWESSKSTAKPKKEND